MLWAYNHRIDLKIYFKNYVQLYDWSTGQKKKTMGKSHTVNHKKIMYNYMADE